MISYSHPDGASPKGTCCSGTVPFKNEVYYDLGLIPEDEDDNKFVNCAIAANAQHIVSNDGHFQGLKTVEFPQVSVLTVDEFERYYKGALTE